VPPNLPSTTKSVENHTLDAWLDAPSMRMEDMLKLVPEFLMAMRNDGLATTTVRDYRTKLGQFIRWLRDDGREFTRRTVQLYLKAMQEGGLRPRTIRCTYTALRTYTRFLRNEGMEAPPLENIRLPRLDAPQRVSPTDEQVGELFKGAERMPAHTWVARYRKKLTLALLATFAYAGLRAFETLGLDVSDYDAEKGRLRVRKAKGGQMRWVPVNDDLALYLNAWLLIRAEKAGTEPALFLNDKYRRLGVRGLTGLWRTLLEFGNLSASGIQRHSLRHWFASGAAREDLVTAKELLGHSSLTTTQGYLHSEPERMKSATDRLVGLVRRQGEAKQEERIRERRRPRRRARN
jgi:site-specific recombinase XerD